MISRAILFFQRADWLDAQRVRGYALILALASLALMVNSFVKAMGPDGTDFLAFWGAGHVAADGDPAFVNPPPFLFAATPFGMMPFPLAWVAWVAATYALWAWAAIRAFPGLWLPVLVFPGALLAAGHAQTGFLTGAMLVGGVAMLDRRPVLSGALLGALIIKPHLALLIPFWLAAGRRWTAFLAAGCCAIGLLLMSWAVFGTDTMIAYTTSWQASAAIMRGDDPDFYLRMATFYSQLRLFAGHGIALVLNAGLALALVGLALASWRRCAGDALASGALVLAATALASPYLFNYDLPFLILPIAWLVREGLRHGFRDWEKAALVALWLAPYATRAAALPLGLNLMPLASIVLLWLVWSRAAYRSTRTA